MKELYKSILTLLCHHAAGPLRNAVSPPAFGRMAGSFCVIVALLSVLPFQAATMPTVSAAGTSEADSSEPVMAASKRARDDVWRMTRLADVVVVADVESADERITVKIGQILKGQADAASLSFVAPPRPLPYQKGICPPPRTWSFVIGERCVLFLKKDDGAYSFMDGRTRNTDETLTAVKEFLAFQGLTNDADRVRFLVPIIAKPLDVSWPSAMLEINPLNKPEFLDLLAPLAGGEAKYRHVYISLLGANTNPKATVLLRAMLHTESGHNLGEVIDALGRKDKGNEEISKELLPFLDHTDPVIRSRSTFILNYRDYRNAFPRIVKALDDPAPAVRANALTWPWYSYVNDHPEVVAKLKALTKDADPLVQQSAKRALARTSKWYRLWYFHR